MRFLVWLASTAAALALATWLLDGMSIDGDGWREQIGPLLVVNAWMLMIVGWIADKADIGFQVDGFWTALLGAIIITLTESFLNAVLED